MQSTQFGPRHTALPQLSLATQDIEIRAKLARVNAALTAIFFSADDLHRKVPLEWEISYLPACLQSDVITWLFFSFNSNASDPALSFKPSRKGLTPPELDRAFGDLRLRIWPTLPHWPTMLSQIVPIVRHHREGHLTQFQIDTLCKWIQALGSKERLRVLSHLVEINCFPQLWKVLKFDKDCADPSLFDDIFRFLKDVGILWPDLKLEAHQYDAEFLYDLENVAWELSGNLVLAHHFPKKWTFPVTFDVILMFNEGKAATLDSSKALQYLAMAFAEEKEKICKNLATLISWVVHPVSAVYPEPTGLMDHVVLRPYRCLSLLYILTRIAKLEHGQKRLERHLAAINAVLILECYHLVIEPEKLSHLFIGALVRFLEQIPRLQSKIVLPPKIFKNDRLPPIPDDPEYLFIRHRRALYATQVKFRDIPDVLIESCAESNIFEGGAVDLEMLNRKIQLLKRR